MILSRFNVRSSAKRRTIRPLRRGLIALLAVTAGIITLASGAIAQILRTSPLLQFGDQGDEVEALQSELRQQRFYDGDITGFYGTATEAAVRQLQRRFGLTEDGVFGRDSQSALLSNSGQGPSGQFPPSTNPDSPRPIRVSRGDFCTASTVSGGSTDSRVLQVGDAGQSVIALQERLTELRYNPGPVDGEFGSQTRQAVIAFQRDQGLLADGIAGLDTQRALRLVDSSDDAGNYVVVIPADTDDVETLEIAQREVEQACFARARQGSYIYAGDFSSRSAAESVSLRLRALDLDSRVEYLRRLRFFN